MGTTLQERLDWLDEAREADADLGFPGRMLALCSLPKSLSRTIRRSGLWLPPGARLPFEPLGRRKPAARTLDARPSGRLSLPCPCRHCAALHSAPLRPPAVGFGRCRRSWVSGNAHKPLNA